MKLRRLMESRSPYEVYLDELEVLRFIKFLREPTH